MSPADSINHSEAATCTPRASWNTGARRAGPVFYAAFKSPQARRVSALRAVDRPGTFAALAWTRSARRQRPLTTAASSRAYVSDARYP